MKIELNFDIGDVFYVIDIPTERTVICENLEKDDNFDENGECKKDCYKDCCLPLAHITKVVVNDIVISITEDGQSIVINGYLEPEDLHTTYESAEKALEELKK